VKLIKHKLATYNGLTALIRKGRLELNKTQSAARIEFFIFHLSPSNKFAWINYIDPMGKGWISTKPIRCAY